MSKNSHYIPKHQEIHLFRLYKLCLYLQKKDASFDTSFPKKMNYSGKLTCSIANEYFDDFASFTEFLFVLCFTFLNKCSI